MSAKPETRQMVKEIIRRVVVQAIPVKWASSEVMPGAGERKSHYRGAGSDFDGFEEYMPGDDPREIDWNATALTGGQIVLVSRYREQRELKAYVMVDTNPSMDFGTTRVSKRELAAELAASFVASLDETRDRVGLVTFSAQGAKLNQKAQTAYRMMMPILTDILEAAPKASGSGDGLAKALKVLPSTRSIVFLVSDFLNLTEEDWSALKRAARRHDIVCFYVQDVRERELPQVNWGPGPLGWLFGWLGCFYTLQDWTGLRKTIWVNNKTRAQYAANFRRHEASIIARFKDARCRWLVVSTEEGDAARQKIRQTLGSAR